MIRWNEINNWSWNSLRPKRLWRLRNRSLATHHIPQRALKHQTPIQALQKWRAEKPDLFVKRIYKQAGLDRVQVPPRAGHTDLSQHKQVVVRLHHAKTKTRCDLCALLPDPGQGQML